MNNDNEDEKIVSENRFLTYKIHALNNKIKEQDLIIKALTAERAELLRCIYD